MEEMMDALTYLIRARREELLALSASDPANEDEHRKLAARLVTIAVREIQREPRRALDWANLAPVRNLQ